MDPWHAVDFRCFVVQVGPSAYHSPHAGVSSVRIKLNLHVDGWVSIRIENVVLFPRSVSHPKFLPTCGKTTESQPDICMESKRVVLRRKRGEAACDVR